MFTEYNIAITVHIITTIMLLKNVLRINQLLISEKTITIDSNISKLIILLCTGTYTYIAMVSLYNLKNVLPKETLSGLWNTTIKIYLRVVLNVKKNGHGKNACKPLAYFQCTLSFK